MVRSGIIRGMARGEKATEYFRLRMTPSERETLKWLAEDFGMGWTESDVIRELIEREAAKRRKAAK